MHDNLLIKTLIGAKMNEITKKILKNQKCKIQILGKTNYNIFSEGQVIHPSAGTIFLIHKIKLNKKETWIEFKGKFQDNTEKNVNFSIHPKNIYTHLKIL
jgi:hypothetical protein